jgi:hypothetical protein
MTQSSRPPLVCHGHTRPVPELNFRCELFLRMIPGLTFLLHGALSAAFSAWPVNEAGKVLVTKVHTVLLWILLIP